MTPDGLTQIRKRIHKQFMKKGPKEVLQEISDKYKLSCTFEPLTAIYDFLKASFTTMLPQGSSNLVDKEKSLHYLFYSKVLLATFHHMEQRLLSFISTSCSASSSSDKAEVISKILENLSDFTLQMDPDRPTQFLLPFLVSPMLQLLESMFVSSTTGSCLQRGNTNKNNDSLPLKFPKKLYRRIVESRQIYSACTMKLKRYIWFADQEDMDFAEATNCIDLPSDAGSHLGLNLLRFDMKHFLVTFLTTQFEGFPLTHYMTANKVQYSMENVIEELLEIHGSSSLSVYLTYIGVQNSLILENPNYAIGLAVLRSQFLMRLQAAATVVATNNCDFGEILTQEPLYKTVWCLEVCSLEPQKCRPTLNTLLRELKGISKLEMMPSESFILGELGHLLKHPAYQVTLFRFLILIATDISFELAAASSLKDRENGTSFLEGWPKGACEKFEDFLFIYRMILLSESFVTMFTEGIYFLPEIPSSFYLNDQHPFYRFFFDLFDTEDIGEKVQGSIDAYFPPSQITFGVGGERENERTSLEHRCLENFKNLGVGIFKKEIIFGFVRACNGRSLFSNMSNAIIDSSATLAPHSYPDSSTLPSFEKSLFLTLVLDWIMTKPLEDVSLRNVFRLALQIATFEEIEFWESFIERCVKYHYDDEATSLLPYMLEIFQLFGADHEISQCAKLKKAGTDAKEVRFLQSVLSGCRRMVPQWDKKYVGLVIKKIIQVWRESYSEYPMLFEDLKWIIQFSQ